MKRQLECRPLLYNVHAVGPILHLRLQEDGRIRPMSRATGNQRQMYTSGRGKAAKLGAHVQETYGEAGKGRDAPLKHWHVAEVH